MRQIRYRLWSVNPLNPEDERPLSGTFTLHACCRVIAVHRLRENSSRVLIARPVACRIPAGHPYTCQVYVAKTDRAFLRTIRAADASAAVRECIRRFGASVDEIAVWVYDDDREAGSPPVLMVNRAGRMWKSRRFAS